MLMEAVTRVRAAEGIEAVTAARDLGRLTEETMHDAVARARSAGATWQEIGDALGASRQAAFQRFGRPGAPPADPAACERALRVFTDLVAGRLAPVLEAFDEPMAAAVSETRMRETLDRVSGLVGGYESTGEPFAHRAGDLTVVRVPLRFEAGEMTGQVTFAPDGRIAGLLITPAGAI